MSRISDNFLGWALAATGAVLAIAAVASVLLLSTPTTTSAAPRTATSSGAVAVSARRTDVGTILVGPGGTTLYAFSRDGRNRDACAPIRGCLGVWPIVTARGGVSAGHGVTRSLLSTTTVDGERQVTYAGHPLYTYAVGEPRSTEYVGVSQSGGTWPAVSPSGRLVR